MRWALLWLCTLDVARSLHGLRRRPRSNTRAAPRMEIELRPCVIKVIGVGGGGNNAVNRMITSDLRGVEFWSINTDAQALMGAKTEKRLNIGREVTRGLGAGGDPAVGRQSALESVEEIEAMVAGADLVFITAGMGGGTGSGAAPIVAAAAKKCGALTVGVVTKPFGFEGRRRMKQAVEAIEELKKNVDTIIVVSNDKLLSAVPANTPVQDAFLVADDILRQGIIGISEIIVKPGLINVDFADVRAVMQNSGSALMGIGTGRGPQRAEEAALGAISSPLLDFTVLEARGIILNVIGGTDLSLSEIQRACRVIEESVADDTQIIFGATVQEGMENEMSITVLATGVATSAATSTDPLVNKLLRPSSSAEKAPAPPSRNRLSGTKKPPPPPPPPPPRRSGLPGFLRR
ncbi:Tubulin/FtsZ, GTPase domain-containing protein [Pelagophyceae sp. CCMP2097]|nr:Tubulin/FtsZ, GTPase domain-containing protein [Pelagophyceae sp. CCMP2097]